MTQDNFSDSARTQSAHDMPADEFSEFASPTDPNNVAVPPPGSRSPRSESLTSIQGGGGMKSEVTEQAGQVKEVAFQRGSDVTETAKDEVARLTAEARDHFRGLWSEASDQLAEQVNRGRMQFADLLHSLSSELGHMASRSEQNGPVTAFARQAASRGGEWAHYLENTEPRQMARSMGSFARRRPFVFLAGAAAAGVLVGRLSRGLAAGGGSHSAVTSGGVPPTRQLGAGSLGDTTLRRQEMP